MSRYLIHEDNIERLEKKLATIRKKCAKFGCDFKYEKLGEKFEKRLNEETRKYETFRFIEVDVEGTAVINGWEFVAVVEKIDDSEGNIITGYRGIEVPKRYYEGELYCEHCNTHRKRKSVCLIRNIETGEFKQVGKKCLMDYTGGLSAEYVAMVEQCVRELEEDEKVDFYGGVGRYARYYEVQYVLRLAFESVKHWGFAKTWNYYERGECPKGYESTASVVGDILAFRRGDFIFRGKKTDEHLKWEKKLAKAEFDENKQTEIVEKAVAWLNEQEERSEYIHNLKTIANASYCEAKHFGILVSLTACYNRYVEKIAAEKERILSEKNSKYVGEIGKRITVSINHFKLMATWNTDYGCTALYKFVDDDGNVLTWKCSGSFNDEAEGKLLLTGTVKSHSEYKGTLQTELTRCKAKWVK